MVRSPNASSAKRVLVGVLGEVRVQADVEPLGELGGRAHELGRHRERRARRRARSRTIAPHDGSWCSATSRSLSARISSSSCTTESGGRPPSFSDRLIEPRVGWNRKPSSCAARISAVMRSPPPRGMHVEVVGRRRAPAERELGQPDPRRHVRGLLVEQRPARVQRREPLEQRAVHRGPVAAGEVLVDVVVRVDQPRRHQAAVGVAAPRRAPGGGSADVAERVHEPVVDRDPAAARAHAARRRPSRPARPRSRAGRRARRFHSGHRCIGARRERAAVNLNRASFTLVTRRQSPLSTDC